MVSLIFQHRCEDCRNRNGGISIESAVETDC